MEVKIEMMSDDEVCVGFNLCGGLSEYRNIAVSKIKLHTESREPCPIAKQNARQIKGASEMSRTCSRK